MYRMILLFGLLGAWPIQSQITHPRASPFAVVEQTIGLSRIRIEYSRPAARGRHIFGPQADGQKGLVPYGRIWRVGANESTKITVDTEVKVMGNLLPKGTYALYAFPEAREWELVFHNNTEHWGDGRKNYNPKEDRFRVKVAPQQISYHQENFLMAFDSITHNAGVLNLIWGHTMVSVPFEVETDTQMQLEISERLNDAPTAQTYYEGARYLQETGQESRRALDYLKKAITLGGDTYYYHRVKSLVEADLGDYNAAVQSAKKSLAIAAKLEKDEFVRMNEKNIKIWETLLAKE